MFRFNTHVDHIIVGFLPRTSALVTVCILVLVAPFSAETKESPFRVGVLYWSMNIPGQVAMRKGLEAEAKAINQRVAKTDSRGVTLLPNVAGEGDDGIERQIAQFQDLIQQRTDIIIVQPTDNAALVPVLKSANEAGIPVVAYDQYISEGELTSFLTSDNYQAGYLDGEYMAHHFPDEYTIKLILVEYPHVSSTVERVNGLMDALQGRRQKFEVLKTYIAVEPESGRLAGKTMLADFPEKGSVDAVFTVNDGGGLAVVEELEAAGRREIFVATIDGDPAAVAKIKKGDLIRIDSAQFCGPLGEEAMKTAYRVLRGKPVARQILIPVFPVTRETFAQYKGWMGPIPDRFKKPWPSRNPEWNHEPKAVSGVPSPTSF